MSSFTDISFDGASLMNITFPGSDLHSPTIVLYRFVPFIVIIFTVQGLGLYRSFLLLLMWVEDPVSRIQLFLSSVFVWKLLTSTVSKFIASRWCAVTFLSSCLVLLLFFNFQQNSWVCPFFLQWWQYLDLLLLELLLLLLSGLL